MMQPPPHLVRRTGILPVTAEPLGLGYKVFPPPSNLWASWNDPSRGKQVTVLSQIGWAPRGGGGGGEYYACPICMDPNMANRPDSLEVVGVPTAWVTSG